MKFILAAVLCALSVKTVLVMPVAESGIQSDRLAVVPLEKNAPIQDTPHILRRETSETAASEVSVHREGETAEEHAKHAHLPTSRLEDNAEKTGIVKTEESKPLTEEVKLDKTAADLSDKKEEEKKAKSEEVIEDAIAAKAAAADIITPMETLAPIPAVPVAPVPVENKVDTHITEGKNAPTKDISSELKEEVKSEEQSSKAVEKTEEPQQIAKSSSISTKSEASTIVKPIAAAATVAESESSPKHEEKIESVVAESEQKAVEEPKEDMKEAEDKTDRVTRGTEDTVPLDSAQAAPAALLTSISAAASAPVAEKTVTEPKEKLVDEIKKENTELPEKKLDTAEPNGKSDNEEKSEMAKLAESSLIVEASETAASADAVEKSEKVAENEQSSVIKSAEQTLEAKSASTELEAQPEAQSSSSSAAAAAAAVAAAAPSEAKLESVVDTINAKTVSTDASKESTEAVKAEDSSSSEEKSSEEDHSNEKLEKSVETKSSDEPKKDESKVEELPKPQEVKEIKEDE